MSEITQSTNAPASSETGFSQPQVEGDSVRLSADIFK
jgi:hypothetical protein